MRIISKDIGRTLFGQNPEAYDAYRPSYPAELYEVLERRCGLAPGTHVFEVGPGTGQATRELLRRGADPLVAVEPDADMAAHLAAGLATAGISVIAAPFEKADLSENAFDLGVAAMSFHWIDEDTGLAKIARLLKPGGWWAMWWTAFGDPRNPDEFYRAADPILKDLPLSPASARRGKVPFAADTETRLSALGRYFDETECLTFEQAVEMDAATVRGLFSTFSPILSLEPERRTRVLDELEHLAREEFGNRIRRTFTTRLYLGRRIG
jgi:SAM-dependent methyltransferase